jgi:transposase
MRKTAHVYGAIAVDDASFTYQFAPVFNAKTYLRFLKQLIRRFPHQKLFLITDNGPCHNLDDDGKRWLSENAHRIELHRLPPYSPEFNPMEPVWKTTRKMTTHNRFYEETQQRDAALRATFHTFQIRPALIEAHVAVVR